MSKSLEELRKSFSLLKEISSKVKNAMGSLPVEAKTLLEGIERKLSELESFDREIRTTSSINIFRKRRLEKQIRQGVPELRDALTKAVRLHADLLRQHYTELKKLQTSIITFDVKIGRTLSKLSFPPIAGDFSTMLPVLARFASTLESLSTELRSALRRHVNDMLEHNRALIKTYDRFVGIDKSDVPVSAERESVGEASISELFNLRSKLRKEQEYLASRRGEVVKTMRANLTSSVETTLSLLETAKSLKLTVPSTIISQFKSIAKQVKDNDNLTSLLSLVQQYDSQVQKVCSEVRNQILEFLHGLNRTLASGDIPSNVSFLPPPPEEIPEDADLATLIAGYERLRSYRTNLETALRNEIHRILDEFTRAANRKVLPNSSELAQYARTLIKKIDRANLEELVKYYAEVSTRLREERGKLLGEIRNLEELLMRISDTAGTILDKTSIGSIPPPVRGTDETFSQIVDAYARVTKHVERYTELFRKAWERELNALLGEIQVIKPAYRESFKTMEDFLQSAIERIRSSKSFEEIEAIAREARGEALYKTQDAIENLKYRLDLKLRLAVSKLLGMNLPIPADVQAAIKELGSIAPASETYEEAIRKAQSIVELFERRIVGQLNQTLNEQIKAFSDLMQVSKSLGIRTDTYLKKLVKIQEKLPASIEDIADRFDELTELFASPQLLRDIRNKANEVWRNLNSAANLLERQGQADTVAKLKNLLAKVPEQLSTDSVTSVLEICLGLIEAQKSVLEIIKSLDRRITQAFEEEMESSTEYYSTIKRVYASRPKEFSQIIFPLKTLETLRRALSNATSLAEAINLFNTIRHLESQWAEKLKEIDGWHKALRVFLADFNPTAPKAERNRQLDEIESRIRETYTREDTASYLAWAARELAAIMAEKKKKKK